MSPANRLDAVRSLSRHYGAPGTALAVARRSVRARALSDLKAAGAWTADAAKRAVDVTATSALLVVIAPALLALAAVIKLDDGGPVLFWQRRVGRDGREFAFPKFRSMVVNAEQVKAALASQNDHGAQGVTFKMKHDPRITRVGRVLRKFSLDELPQLWCVITGDMSLVGPRPPVPGEVRLYKVRDRRRLDVTPGLTCIWQVSGRSEIPFEKQVRLDVDYINERSLWLDVKLLFRTIPAVLSGRGAY